jgi:uncharacterized membrane protein
MKTVHDKRDGVACYLAGVLFPIIFLATEPYKSNRFIRFHSFQSIIFFLIVGAWQGVVLVVPSVRRLTGTWLGVAFFATWILLMIKAYQGQTFKLPLIGDYAERYA